MSSGSERRPEFPRTTERCYSRTRSRTDITGHYSAPDLGLLLEEAEKVTRQDAVVLRVRQKNGLSNDNPFSFKFGAGNETRTRDPNLGKVVLYQLSYSRCEDRLF